ncbi:hypothetical protein KFK09_011253 [Dendrobium nobile]|uniref:Uncharacterized protein n=1 Tax=Dendrobium nobile TaxID=94219 RepID=A0A8T3BFE6_DENNO|nr:hypothetical protein KFK09_011253 [Dendrobium nobile]
MFLKINQRTAQSNSSSGFPFSKFGRNKDSVRIRQQGKKGRNLIQEISSNERNPPTSRSSVGPLLHFLSSRGRLALAKR